MFKIFSQNIVEKFIIFAPQKTIFIPIDGKENLKDTQLFILQETELEKRKTKSDKISSFEEIITNSFKSANLLIYKLPLLSCLCEKSTIRYPDIEPLLLKML